MSNKRLHRTAHKVRRPVKRDVVLKKGGKIMQCSNCGKNVEFAGNICPYCGTPKIQDQRINIFAYLYGFGGAAIGAGLGLGVNEEVGWLVGGFIGMIIGTFAGILKGSAPFAQNIQCPHCGITNTVNPAQGPNFQCYKCKGIFHIQ